LPLLLRDAREMNMPLFDTTQLHIQRAVRELLA
jgi:aspartate/glutamate racemase